MGRTKNKRRKVPAKKTKGKKSDKQVHVPAVANGDDDSSDNANVEQSAFERAPRPSIWKRSLIRFIFIIGVLWLYKLYVSYRYGIDVTGSDTNFSTRKQHRS